ncbi:1-deoxy-D-xylulose-5-phosphate synthase [Ligilactobacillus agilis]|uniref:1-deoxy-D-xylulose-5-phosphate synthase n=1 Tax=Ligilactobacillus agilis TaxID=1601 RepID=UPI001DD685D3|nr:1-deoxy-D-xylulose-5-phosphate synthase [Ligilactobacillus agilis]HJG05785.1 1-deoxy-D-xylulose-5-phosphate synthase [Ligilactobacillus agilis]
MNQHPDYLLNKVTRPADIKAFSMPELKQLANEMRQLVLEKDAAISGHVGPNLGAMEATIAFHYVFDSPKDKIIWDISHLAYGHKMLTGRKEAFLDPDHYHDVSGYSAPDESEHDFFTVGHTSTSVALAVGMAKARDVLGQQGNIVAFIGDGSLSGGLAFEGLNNASVLKSNLIIVVNDNQMSIAENQGGLYQALADLRASNGQAKNNFFMAMGFDYHYVSDGNDLKAMITAFEEVKDSTSPVVLHINTLKGKGYQPAVNNKERFHWSNPFDLKTGRLLKQPSGESYAQIIMDELDKQVKAGQPIVAMNAAIPGTFKLHEFEAKHPDRYLDTGIAEQDCLTEAARLAKGGAKPVVFQNSTFMQRAYDQLSHDVALNDLPVIIMVNGGINGGSKTHLGIFDIPYLNTIPNINYLHPSNQAELLAMLRWALAKAKHPVAIRIPSKPVVLGTALQEDFALSHYDLVREGKTVALLGLGKFAQLAVKTAELLAKKGRQVTVVKPYSATSLDEECLSGLEAKHQLVVTLEDASIVGGFGSLVSQFYADKAMKVLNYGAAKKFTDNISQAELYKQFHLTPELLAQDIEENL